MLSVTDLSKEYPTARGPLRVLSGVSFEIAPGDAAAIMGPSGSGKSSLLYILGGLEPPTSGALTLDGRNPYELSATALAAFRNKEIGFVFQDHCLLPQCTVLENVLIPTLVASRSREETSGASEPRERRGDRGVPASERVGGSGGAKPPGKETTRARELIEQVGLGDRIEHRPAELSGGERQRVAIARALIRRPRLLLCDEPTGNLDRTAAENVAEVLLDLHRLQKTILIVVTHSAALAEKLPTRFDLLDGQLRRQ